MSDRNSVQIIHGDALDVLKTLESESIQCCVTSPPYFGLRDYDTAQWQGGDDPDCDHKHPDQFRSPNSKVQNANNSGESARVVFHDSCGKCGAVRIDEQIGLEKTPQDYVKKLVAVFDEVHRVLKADGTLWLNLGDSYWTGNGGLRKTAKAVWPWKNKDLIGIPWRVAFALQEAGWYLRQDIIWAKPNPMPESVRDRCTKSHEYLFLLTKSPNYYYDQDAIREPLKDSSVTRLIQNIHDQKGSDRVPGKTNGNMKAVVKRDESLPRNRNGKGASTLDLKPVRIGGNKYGDDDSVFSRTKSGKEWQPGMAENGPINNSSRSCYFNRETAEPLCGTTANKKSVWIVATAQCKEAHFATFPEKLIEPCILAGSREGDLVLDPFSGSGTTGIGSLKYNRRYVGIELNPEYIEIAKRRLKEVQPRLI